MPELSRELIALLQYLAPGFLVTGIFYGTTSHERPSQFERVVQALLYTVLVQAIVATVRVVAIAMGQFISLGIWTSESTLVASISAALAVGFVACAWTNHDTIHARLRKFGVTQRTSYPSEWVQVFNKSTRFVILNLRDGSRLSGWPAVWPASPEKGHFYITEGVWLRMCTDNRDCEVEGILISATDVTQIEFL
ncbi:hypothetical protein FIV34_01640 [Luteibacter pinisoli]|uniref:Uncharacterized protein n=1 Tax=Luteibacter pinisoli TaxID=2589080 RepID=A0A4Y5YZI1_9GAMM|nr:DUF6338 family protein [Luteibacter pinisoli]QDE37986.1 hypothetical protein FIV34_01640 [Luteibacter pinisoli]